MPIANYFTQAIFKITKINQHALAMSLLIKEFTTCCGQGPSSYAPIVQALTMLSDSEKAKGMGYFDRYLTITL